MPGFGTPGPCAGAPERAMISMEVLGTMVRMYSRLLQEAIICVEDNQAAGDAAGRVLYTRSEVLALRGLSPDDLRAVHELKKYFGGRYEGSAPAAE